MKNVRTYILDISNKPYDVKRITLLEEKRRQNSEQAKNFLYKLRTLYSGLLLRYALEKEGEVITTPLNVKYNSFGKPFITDGIKSFSITHSGNLVIVAVCDGEVGIDAEIVQKKVYTHIAPAVFSETELSEYEVLYGKEKTDYFLKHWTAKEAYLKYVGTGINRNLKEYSLENGKIKGVPVHTEKLTSGSYEYVISLVCGEDVNCEKVFVKKV